jgi:hypothetical protein
MQASSRISLNVCDTVSSSIHRSSLLNTVPMKRLLESSDTSVVADATGATRHGMKVAADFPSEEQRVPFDTRRSLLHHSPHKKARTEGLSNKEIDSPCQSKALLFGEDIARLSTPEPEGSKPAGKAPESTIEVKKSARATSGRRHTFPDKLMDLLNSGDFTSSMSWLADGSGFSLHPEVFMKDILPKHFEGTKFESFTRKLNRWGFKRIAGEDAPEDTFAYSHHLFKRDCPELCGGMSGGKKAEHDLSHLSRFRGAQHGDIDIASSLGGGLALSRLASLGAVGQQGLVAMQSEQLKQLLFERQLAAAGITPSMFATLQHQQRQQHQQNAPPLASLEREIAIREMLLLQQRHQQEPFARSQQALLHHQQRLQAAEFEAQQTVLRDRALLQKHAGRDRAVASEMLFRREQEEQAARYRLQQQISALQAQQGQDIGDASAQARAGAMNRLRGPFGGM